MAWRDWVRTVEVEPSLYAADFAGQSGEIPVTLEFPQGEDFPSYLSGDQEWRWTAHFEAFASAFDTGRGRLATPAGDYRFAVSGRRRAAAETLDRSVASETNDRWVIRWHPPGSRYGEFGMIPVVRGGVSSKAANRGGS